MHVTRALCCVKHITTDTLWRFLLCAHLLEPCGGQQWADYLIAALLILYIAAASIACSLLSLRLNGAKQHCTSVKNTYCIESALVASVAVDIFEPEEFSAVSVVQCFALHLLVPFPTTNICHIHWTTVLLYHTLCMWLVASLSPWSLRFHSRPVH